MKTRTNIYRALLVAVVVSLFVPVFGAQGEIKFSSLSVNDGLSQSTVTALAQDSQGNMWLGTRDGLNRYDGYSFTTFHADKYNDKALWDNSITSLKVDSQSRLWIGTSEGLSLYDPKREEFSNYRFIERSVQVNDIALIENGLLLATANGIKVFDTQSCEVEQELLSGINVRSLCEVKGGREYLLATISGLYIYSLDSRRCERLLHELSSYDMSCVVASLDEGYWISTHGRGLLRIGADFTILSHFRKAEYRGLSSDYIRVLKMDHDGNLWIGTYDGLSILNPDTKRFDSYTHSLKKGSISHNSIWSIFMDNQRGVWLGTYYGGVNYYNRLLEKFSVIESLDTSDPTLLSIVSCIVYDEKTENLWVGTNEDGVFLYDPKSGSSKRFDEGSVQLVNGTHISDNIKCILPDGSQWLYVGSHIGGLSRLNIQTRRVENFQISSSSPLHNGCYSLLEGVGDELWVGTLNGLYSFDKRTHRFQRHKAAEHDPNLASHQIMVLYRDSEQRVWVGTNAGLYLCSESGSTVRSLVGVRGDDGSLFGEVSVQCISEDSYANIWVGTQQGLYRYNHKTGGLNRYTIRDGLPNDSVYGILEDELGRLWLSTNNGLSLFDPHQESFRNYRHREGISNNQFNNYAYCKDGHGNFYFGGLGGITSFRPLEMIDNPFAPTPIIKELRVLGGENRVQQGVELERGEDGALRSATFNSRMNLFSIHFSAVNLISGSNNSYRYTLEGFDESWHETSLREVSYSNLAPGEYKFHLMAANSDGVWSKEEAVLRVEIEPRWWQTTLARVIFMAILLAAIWLVGYMLTLRMKMQIEIDMQRKEKERIEELSQEKIRFYINLSHELRTPLSLILSPLQELQEYGQTDSYIKSRLDYIMRSSTRLLHIVNQMLDYRKAELGMFKLQVREQDVELIAGDVFSLFEEIAQARDMDYILQSELKGRHLPVDRTFLELILINLLTNAFKFTPTEGTIRLSLRCQQDELIISVRDSGIGIAKQKQQRIFERFYQVDESRSGTGIGLSIVQRLVELHHGEIGLVSEENSFSEFKITLPASVDSYSAEERDNSDLESHATVSENLPNYLFDACSLHESDTLMESGEEQARESLLLVADDRETLRYLTEHFRVRYQVFTASSCQQALDQLKSVEPAVIIANRILPDSDGLKLCQSVKQNIRTCHIPIIIIATRDSVQDHISGIEAGADAYVGQPFSINLLQAKVQSLLKSRYRLRHYYSNSQDIEPEKITSNAIDGEFLRRAIEVVERNLDNEEFSSNDFAQQMCMSRSNLHLKITSITGESATKFIRKIRFNHACRLLVERKYTISEISSMVGFNSPSYFATSFKKHVGCLPTEYMKSRQQRADEE